MTLKTTKFDAAELLTTTEHVAAFLEDAFDGGDPAEIADALGIVARAKGMTAIARKSGVSRQTLYSALTHEGNPEFITILKALNALGLKLQAVPAS